MNLSHHKRLENFDSESVDIGKGIGTFTFHDERKSGCSGGDKWEDLHVKEICAKQFFQAIATHD